MPFDPIFSSVPLNGGNLVGRWTLSFEQDMLFRNDTLEYDDTASYPPGELVVEFLAGGTLYIIEAPDTSELSYSVSGNVVTVNDGMDTFTFTYGVASNKLRWYYEEVYWNGPDQMKSKVNYLFDRY